MGQIPRSTERISSFQFKLTIEIIVIVHSCIKLNFSNQCDFCSQLIDVNAYFLHAVFFGNFSTY